MRAREDVCSRFPVGSAIAESFARTHRVAHRGTATGRAIKLLISIGVFAIVMRLILTDQPFIYHWSWRQSDLAAIARTRYYAEFAEYLRNAPWFWQQETIV